MKQSRNEKMLLSLELVDDQLIAEAAQIASGKIKTKERRQRTLKKAALIAASLTVMITALNLWLFLPFPAQPSPLDQYKDSDYYPLIEKLNTYFNLYFTPQQPKNNFEKILSSFSNTKGETLTGLPTNRPSSSGNEHFLSKVPDAPEYHETTDNQVDGIIEGDRFKRSDQYIYYLYYDYTVSPQEAILAVYSIEGEESKQVGSYTIGNDFTDVYSRNIELYLSKDCSTVYLVMSLNSYYGVYYYSASSFVQVQALDVSDPQAIRKIADVRISGAYLSSRMIEDELMVLTDFSIQPSLSFSNESTFIPQIHTASGTQSIPMENIICPDTITGLHYTVACKLKGSSLTVSDSAAFLSYADTVYVSKDTIYATRTYTDYPSNDSNVYSVIMTEIMGISYSDDRFTALGTASVAGSIKNQYSMDEHNGILRVVTSTSEFPTASSSRMENASLYCIDLQDWSIRAKVEKFAPAGESAEAVRFDRSYAYVCTAEIVQYTDPVYFFDLSDPDNITYKDTGTIDGYSTSLVNFGDGYLLGIGVTQTVVGQTFKIELYRETDTGVESVCAYELPKTTYAQDYKSYYIDRERKLIGLGINQYFGDYGYSSDDESRYLLLQWNGAELSTVFNVSLSGIDTVKRGVWIDHYFYLFGATESSVDFKVIEVPLH